jgi:hypothetical protein
MRTSAAKPQTIDRSVDITFEVYRKEELVTIIERHYVRCRQIRDDA